MNRLMDFIWKVKRPGRCAFKKEQGAIRIAWSTAVPRALRLARSLRPRPNWAGPTSG